MGFDSLLQTPALHLAKLHSFPQTALEKRLYLSSTTTPTYTSLKDLMPSNRVRMRSVKSAHEIPISNFLVKKAAWAYLQPMLEPCSMRTCNDWESKHILGRILDDLKSPANACLQFINKYIIVKITRAFDLVLGALLIRS
ncbi:hypothetical protein HS088_TW07G00485 [Tripterygium wilfordii]|uniref:Uncharacterized protein n=1 Tax=Tripterygium wilfordii TaxID=458696 RepID=A0A7J7DF32_TRIWF|nr:hypothetical protein HS088_TW07G00485 [Tripterygium wilfordii]